MELPRSCRPWSDVNEKVTCTPDSDDIACAPYVTGCIKHLSVIIHRSALYIGTGAVAIALIQVSIYRIFARILKKMRCRRDSKYAYEKCIIVSEIHTLNLQLLGQLICHLLGCCFKYILIFGSINKIATLYIRNP